MDKQPNQQQQEPHECQAKRSEEEVIAKRKKWEKKC